jgi:hypothetical protein
MAGDENLIAKAISRVNKKPHKTLLKKPEQHTATLDNSHELESLRHRCIWERSFAKSITENQTPGFRSISGPSPLTFRGLLLHF